MGSEDMSEYMSNEDVQQNKDLENKMVGRSSNCAADVHLGTYDTAIINAFRCNHFDLRQLTSGVGYNQYNSIFHKLGKFIGLSDEDDDVAFMLHRLLILNRRGIRDRLDGCECYVEPPFARIANSGDATASSLVPVERIRINDQNKMNKPTPKIFINKSENLTLSSLSPFREVYEPPDSKCEDSCYRVSNLPTPEQEKLAKKGLAITVSCPRCFMPGETEIQYKIGALSLGSTIAMIVVCCIPCAFIPLLGNCCKDTLYICHNCNYILGVVRKGICNDTIKWNIENAGYVPRSFRKSIIINDKASTSTLHRMSVIINQPDLSSNKKVTLSSMSTETSENDMILE